MSHLFSGDQSVGASASVLPMNIQGWFSLLLTGLISLQSKRLSRVFSSTIIQKHQENNKLRHSAFFMVQLSHLYITPGKTVALTIQIFVSIVISLLFNTLSRFVIAFRDPPNPPHVMSAPHCHENMAPDFPMALILLWTPRLSLIRSNISLNYPINNTSELFSAGSCRPFSLPLMTVLTLVLPTENPTLPTIHVHLPFLQVQFHPSLINPPPHSDSEPPSFYATDLAPKVLMPRDPWIFPLTDWLDFDPWR